MQVKNIFSLKDISYKGTNEYFETLCEHGELNIQRIVSMGQVSPPDYWYEQEKNEWVVLLKGKATLEFENNKLVHLQAGDFLLLPAGLKHRVAYTAKDQPCVWIAVHFK